MASSDPSLAGHPLLNITEVFYSIQGESTFAGYPCVFIRLAGCNLRCSFCDTTYAYEEEGTPTSITDLLEYTRRYPSALVQITGGEPLLQEGVYPLMEQLLQANRIVMLETNGSVSLRNVPVGVIKIMDMKCPVSGMSEKMDLANLGILTSADELKFVISSRADYDWALNVIETHIHYYNDPANLRKRIKILFSPETGNLKASTLAEWILTDGLQVRLQLQLHRILWPDKDRGC
ncbi:MAG: radical SAM protein [Desulfobulbaceae bacterium]|uniref:7-carboxy-7-deazaguanine synthase n=1 Tax=Candidatus Desulfobia pelagia TaxID=2841692 RepID=A0A8J6NEJ4_9BACT|nr:radical SAM protein [Candidatus Desulfobia pelagia]